MKKKKKKQTKKRRRKRKREKEVEKRIGREIIGRCNDLKLERSFSQLELLSLFIFIFLFPELLDNWRSFATLEPILSTFRANN